ncbi:pectinesterase family protein [Flammeovirgaceae bacterium SG7u.111]|nr:pectinesterase family protein [Flammeovirgaceae bacterium SG7u.132]WPO38759.1 pectinesterase family protein [Flammeovirgaceae bacterium SG7u.111]
MLFCYNAVAQDYDVIVDINGKGDFTSVQAAIDHAPHLRKNRTTIFIKNGVYKEKLILPKTKTNISFIGESVEKTILTFDDYSSKKNQFGETLGTSGSSSFFIYGSGFQAENITFENSSGAVGQAVAVRVDGDEVFFSNCKFLGFQDTLYPHGQGSRQYYLNCYIEGTTDFIFGWSTAVFENCEIFSKTGGQYITAASTLLGEEYGFVFINCKLTGDAPDQSVYLGRPWRPYAQTVFLKCQLGKHIRPEGWHNWNKPDAEKTSFYAEFESEGEGASPASRVPWAKQLTKEDLSHYSLQKIFDGWIPNKNSVLNYDH